MSETLSEAKQPKTRDPHPGSGVLKIKAKRRRPDSAVSGGVFLSLRDLQERWGCQYRTALRRARSLPKYQFGQTAVRYKLEHVLAYEQQALVK